MQKYLGCGTAVSAVCSVLFSGLYRIYPDCAVAAKSGRNADTKSVLMHARDEHATPKAHERDAHATTEARASRLCGPLHSFAPMCREVEESEQKNESQSENGM